MVAIKREQDNYIFEILGLRRPWAMKSQLTIPITTLKLLT